jgi:hypothetical protein
MQLSLPTITAETPSVQTPTQCTQSSLFAIDPSTYFSYQNGLEVLILLWLLPFLFRWGSKRNCNTVVVQSSAALNSVGKENNVIIVIQYSQHEPSTLLSLIFQSILLKVFTVVKKII